MKISCDHRFLLATMLVCIHSAGSSQSVAPNTRQIEFPDIPGYQTLVCDFHQHTVFSDGYAWPSIRVAEAIKDGLDAIAITDHIEYRPNTSDIPNSDLNRSYEIAFKDAQNTGLIVIRGAEITREMPPGHANVLFINDVNKLAGLDSLEVFREAKKEGAFVIWNHPHWKAQSPNGTAVLSKMHKQLIKEGLIKGIEIVNEHSWSDEALKIANDNKLTLIGASDIHDMIDWQFNETGGHRPVTLVFAIDKTEDAIKAALIGGKTVVWHDNILAGKQEYLIPLIQQSLYISKTQLNGGSTVVEVSIDNKSDADYILQNQSEYTFYDHSDIVILKAHATTVINVKPLKEMKMFTLKFKVLNAVTAPSAHPSISLNVYTARN